MKTKNRIAITGIGPLTAGGSGKDKVWQSILERKTGLVQKEYKLDGDSLGSFYVHEIKDFNIARYGVDGQMLKEIKGWKENDDIEDLYYFIATIKMAIDDSGLKIANTNKNNIGLMLAHENMGLDHFYMKVINELSLTGKDVLKKPSTKKEFLKIFYEKFHRTGYELQTFMSLHHIAKMFDIHGFSLFLNNACASGLFAIEAAADVIKSGKCSQMVVSAVDKSSVFKQMWFKDINMYAKDGRIKPFASDRDGFTLGDGGAAIMLEDMDAALERKANIYAEYICGSFALEGWKITYPDITNDYYANMVIDVIEKAGVRPSDIDILVPHGVGTTITDKYEARAINKIFGDSVNKPIVTALKPYMGHTLGSTAILETAIMLLAIKNGKIPPTLNCERLDDSLGVNILRDLKSEDNVKFAVKTACGFAGFDGACVFKRLSI